MSKRNWQEDRRVREMALRIDGLECALNGIRAHLEELETSIGGIVSFLEESHDAAHAPPLQLVPPQHKDKEDD